MLSRGSGVEFYFNLRCEARSLQKKSLSMRPGKKRLHRAGFVLRVDWIGNECARNDELRVLGDESKTFWLAFACLYLKINFILFGNGVRFLFLLCRLSTHDQAMVIDPHLICHGLHLA